MKLVLTAGDRQIQDLTPKTTNLGDRIVKNMRICGSGIYTYAMREAALLHLTPVPAEFQNLPYINVFRPPEVLEANKDKFARVPIITGHHVLVDRDNAKELAVGMVGDMVESEVDEQDGETYLYTTGTIVAGDGVEAYEKYGQLSVGYDPIMEWCKGTHNGVPYQAKLTGFKDVNHLLICKTARGGPQCMVMDSLDGTAPLERIFTYGGKQMGFFNKIFGKKTVVGDEAVVSALIQSIAAGADPTIQVPKIKAIVGDSNAEFTGFLDELVEAKDAPREDLSKACDIVDKFYKKNMAGDAATGTDDRTDKVGAGDEEGKDPAAGDESKKTVTVEKKNGHKDVTVKEDDGGKEKTVKVDHEPDGNKKVEVTHGDSIDYDLIAQKTAGLVLATLAKTNVMGDEAVQGTVVIGDSKPAATGMTSDDVMKAFA